MRKNIMAGNWKMNNTLSETKALINELVAANKGSDHCGIVIAPTYTNLYMAKELLSGTNISLAAQNMHNEENGAFTGEISPSMLKELVDYVIIGHSERRTVFNESDEIINKKNHAVLNHGMKLIFCIGETLEEREGNKTLDVLKTQVTNGLKGISADQMKDVVVAYEPVWAIGTGKVATVDQAGEAHAYIRKLVSELYNSNVANDLTIQYGGSVKPENVKELMANTDIDGALVGGASLKANSFTDIINYNK